MGGVKLGDPRIADSSSINAVSFSSARTTKRFPTPGKLCHTVKVCLPIDVRRPNIGAVE
jgi:hypothetical protein